MVMDYSMRLDKFLKISLIFKTRSAAEKAIDRKSVLLNGKQTKPAARVSVGDTLTVIQPLKTVTYRVEAIAEKNVSRQEARELYTVTGEEVNDV
jgi:ribosomal 50S subunit-recycling heat shock protein